MNNRSISMYALALIACLTSTSLLARTVTAEEGPQLQRLERQLAGWRHILNNAINRLNSEPLKQGFNQFKATAEDAVMSMGNHIAARDAEIAGLRNAIHGLDNQIASLKATVAAYQPAQAKLESFRNRVREKVAELQAHKARFRLDALKANVKGVVDQHLEGLEAAHNSMLGLLQEIVAQ